MLMKGPGRIPTPFDTEQNRSKELYARIYTWLEWEMYNNRYSKWPDVASHLVMYDDAYFRNHTWIWNGKPHWAYGKEYMNMIADRGAIEWTPNTIASTVEITGSRAAITLTTSTPNLKTLQMKKQGKNWEEISKQVQVELRNGRNEIEFRAINLADVSGPVHKVIIEN